MPLAFKVNAVERMRGMPFILRVRLTVTISDLNTAIFGQSIIR